MCDKYDHLFCDGSVKICIHQMRISASKSVWIQMHMWISVKKVNYFRMLPMYTHHQQLNAGESYSITLCTMTTMNCVYLLMFYWEPSDRWFLTFRSIYVFWQSSVIMLMFRQLIVKLLKIHEKQLKFGSVRVQILSYPQSQQIAGLQTGSRSSSVHINCCAQII